MTNHKHDIVKFAEDIMGYELMEWQKDLLRMFQNGEQNVVMGYRIGKRMLVEIIKKYNESSNKM